MKTSTEIVRAYIEAVNNNDFDRILEICSPDCVFHGSPYVGLGIMLDDSSGDRIVFIGTAPGGPADGVLLKGDELLRAADGTHTWNTFQDLKSVAWGQGIPGTPLTLTVRRNAQTLDLHLVRGEVAGWDQPLREYIDSWKSYKLRIWPDLKIDIRLIFEKDDLVAMYGINRGTNLEYHRSATWGECDIYRVRDGKITETWSLEDSFAEMKQLGYEIREPQPEPA